MNNTKCVTKSEFFAACGKFLYMSEKNEQNWKDYYENGKILCSFGTKIYMLYI